MRQPSYSSRLIRFLLILLPLIFWSGTIYADDTPVQTGTAGHENSSGEVVATEESQAHDTHAAEGGHGDEGGGVLGILEHHLMDSNHYQFFGMDFHLPVLNIGGMQLPVTKHTIMLITAAILLFVLLIPVKRVRSKVPHGWANFMEVLIVFIRDEIVYPNVGEKHGRKFLPYFLTAFFFILFSNLLGMIPYGSTPTGNIAVTGALAGISLLIMLGAGIVIHGPFKYIASFVPHGVPVFVMPILFPIEIVGVLVKHFALCIRLFANMLAGHAVIAVFLALISSYFIAPIAIVGAVAISLLELFVAFLQSYIFVMLSSLFIGMAVHGEH
jgi:F-type H+-transporting ATPase subunit a